MSDQPTKRPDEIPGLTLRWSNAHTTDVGGVRVWEDLSGNGNHGFENIRPLTQDDRDQLRRYLEARYGL